MEGEQGSPSQRQVRAGPHGTAQSLGSSRFCRSRMVEQLQQRSKTRCPSGPTICW